MGSSVRLREALTAGGPGGTSKDRATADGVLTRTNESSEGRAISPIDAAAAAAGVDDDNEAGKIFFLNCSAFALRYELLRVELLA